MKQLATTYCLAFLLGCCLLLVPEQSAAQVLHGTFDGGFQHSLSIHADGSLWATGDNTYGQLGTGSMTSTSVWVQVGTATNWVQVAAGSSHSLGLRTDGSLYAWGSNQYGQLGTATNVGTTAVNSTPTRIGTDTYTQVAAGSTHSLALKADGSLYAWGQNNAGQLGNTSNNGTTTPNPTPTRVGTDTYTQIAAGVIDYSLGLKADGSLYAWGDNYYGQLGNTVNSGTRAPSPMPTRVGIDTYTQVVAGNSHCLALKADGSLYAWGDNYYGQLGNTTNSHSYTPNPTPTRVGTDTYTQVAAGFEFTIGLRANDSLYAWGINGAGQLGSTINVGTGTANPTPLRVGTVTNWVQVAASFSHSLGLQADGSLYAWGNNTSGQLGNGNTYTPTPTATSTALPTRSTAASGTAGFGIKGDGTLWAWGNNSYGQLGDGTTASRTRPGRVGTDRDWVQVVAGAYHVLALKANGTTWAWGRNNTNQVSPTTAAAILVPTQVSGPVAASLAAGGDASLLLDATGAGYGWGDNTYAQLGTVSTAASLPTPTAVRGGLTFVQLAAGSDFALGRTATGQAYGWGRNYFGQVGAPTGLGTSTPVVAPTLVASAPPLRQISVGSQFSVGLSEAGTAYAWGLNTAGQLGWATNAGTTVPDPTPHAIVGLAPLRQLEAYGSHCLALTAAGTIYSWGYNAQGQLAQGNSGNLVAPVPTQEITLNAAWAQLGTGSSAASSLVRTASSLTFASAGDNTFGQLGDGITVPSPRFDRISPLASLQALPVLAAATGVAFTLAPNPARSQVMAMGLPTGTTLVVYDALGRRVVATTGLTFGVSELPAGLYLVRATLPGQAPQSARLLVE